MNSEEIQVRQFTSQLQDINPNRKVPAVGDYVEIDGHSACRVDAVTIISTDNYAEPQQVNYLYRLQYGDRYRELTFVGEPKPTATNALLFTATKP